VPPLFISLFFLCVICLVSWLFLHVCIYYLVIDVGRSFVRYLCMSFVSYVFRSSVIHVVRAFFSSFVIYVVIYFFSYFVRYFVMCDFFMYGFLYLCIYG